MPVITLSRQFGAGAAAVGRLLAQRFGAEYLDREVVFRAARRAGVPLALAEELDERAPGWLTRLGMAFGAAYPEVVVPYLSPAVPVPSEDQRLAELTRGVIVEAAERGNAIIVGRGAAFILADRPGVLHVQLEASLEARIRYCMMEAEELPPDARPGEVPLRRLCLEVDRARAAYIRRHFGRDWRDPSHYHMVIDTGRLGLETAVELIALAAERLAGRER